MISGDDSRGITALEEYLSSHFHMKDLQNLCYFHWIEVSRSPHGLSLSQRKYLINLLTESSMLGSRPVDTPMDYVVRFEQNLLRIRIDIADSLESLST